MRVIKPYTEILTDLNQPFLKDIERVARTCYKSEDKITEDDSSAKDIVSKLIKRGHEAMLEFGDITVKFVCDRGVSHEIVRHRVASYAQESTRYCNYSKNGELTFIEPNWLQSTLSTFVENGVYTEGLWRAYMEASEKTYLSLINKGWSPQQARSVLPNSIKTELNVKMNLREWRHFFKMRCSNAAHPQMYELTRPLLKEFQSRIPLLFDDITY